MDSKLDFMIISTLFCTDKHVLVVGAGDVALSRIDHLLVADAKITVIAGPDIHPTIQAYFDLGLLEKLESRNFVLSDLTIYEKDNLEQKLEDLSLETEAPVGENEDLAPLDELQMAKIEMLNQNRFAMVLTCINNYPLSLRIWQECKKLSLNVNLADKPAYCDFYFGSVYRRGPLQIMISTNGKSPRLCNRIKNKMLIPMFEKLEIDKAVENLAYLRGKLRNEIHPGEETATIKERMEWNKKITDYYSIHDWCTMNTEFIDQILKLYPTFPEPESD